MPRPEMNTTPAHTEPDGATLRPAMTEDYVRALQQGDAESWRRLLCEQHAVFERALRIAARRTGGDAFAVVRDPQAVDDAKVYFYEAFRRGFREFVGEGQFFGFLYRAVWNFVREAARAARRSAARPPEPQRGEGDGTSDPGEFERRAVDQWRDGKRGLDAGLEARLQQCLLRLPDAYRSVVVMHHFERETQPLQSLAEVLQLTVAAIQKRYQRAMALLRECLSAPKEEHHVA